MCLCVVVLVWDLLVFVLCLLCVLCVLLCVVSVVLCFLLCVVVFCCVLLCFCVSCLCAVCITAGAGPSRALSGQGAPSPPLGGGGSSPPEGGHNSSLPKWWGWLVALLDVSSRNLSRGHRHWMHIHILDARRGALKRPPSRATFRRSVVARCRSSDFSIFWR